MKVKILYLIFRDLEFFPSDIPKLRGYFAEKLKNYTELHNHLPGGKFDYRFPRIQYRIIDGHPALIAIKEGIHVVKKIFLTTEEIILTGKISEYCQTKEKSIFLKDCEFGQTSNFTNYHFSSPWMALNEDNYRKYRNSNLLERQALLKKILKGNFITLSKGFGYTIPDLDNLCIEGFFHPKLVNFKNKKMQSFTGEFLVNFTIPDMLGLGKQSARGFGVVKRTERGKV